MQRKVTYSTKYVSWIDNFQNLEQEKCKEIKIIFSNYLLHEIVGLKQKLEKKEKAIELFRNIKDEADSMLFKSSECSPLENGLTYDLPCHSSLIEIDVNSLIRAGDVLVNSGASQKTEIQSKDPKISIIPDSDSKSSQRISILKEIFSTEKTYLDHLQVVIELYLNPIVDQKNEDMFTEDEFQTLFSNSIENFLHHYVSKAYLSLGMDRIMSIPRLKVW
jgi:hypothetical protein